MPVGRRRNQTLVGLLFVMFLLNIWLLRTVNWMGKLPCFSNSVSFETQYANQDKEADIMRIVNRKQNYSTRTGLLTIGIPTVHRKKGFYIIDSLQSIINNTSNDDKSNIKIIVFTADSNITYNQKVYHQINLKFRNFVNSGLIKVIHASKNYYPTFQDLKRTHGDSEQRVVWRSKQVLDYAFLFQYCHHLSNYYLQLEDDVKTSPNFVQSIQEYILLNKNEIWTTLEFSELGFIGKLLHSRDLIRFKDFVLLFYEDQPIDYLLKYFSLLNGQKTSFLRVPSLFQHIGSFSSLPEKKQPLKDRFFEENSRIYEADNPPANIYSNIPTFSMYWPNLAYTNDPGYFWGLAPKVGDVILVIFQKAVRLKRVVFESGSPSHPEDILESGRLTAGRQVLVSGDKALPMCNDEIDLGVFNGGRVDVKNIEDQIKYDVACLKVLVTGRQSHWVVLREIGVWILR